jgi:uncharacterized phosphosugar-binding protein
MPTYSQQFFSLALKLIETVSEKSAPAIEQTAEAIAQAILSGNQLFVFGSGHSALIARDAAGRAGGLVPVTIIEDVIDGDAERVEGFARIIASRYALEAGSVLIVISNSGINAVPIEMAQLGKDLGLTVVAITSLPHSQSVETRHSSGKKLYEVADIVIDTHGERGDALLPVPGSEYRTGALSTMIGCAIVQAITVETVKRISDQGEAAPILVSANVPEGREHNLVMLKKYRNRLARFQLPLRWD